MAVSPEQIHVAGVGLKTRWIGPGPTDAPTIVLVHDGRGGLGDWGGWAEGLAQATGCGVVQYGRADRGSAATVPSAQWVQDEALIVLPRLLDGIGLRRGVLLGCGDGASIATVYAGGIEDHRVRGLVLLSPRFFDAGRPAAAGEGGCPDLRDFLGYIRIPILVIQGGADPGAGAEQRQAIREETYCPVEVVIVEGAGARPHIDRPDATLAAVSGFVSTLTEAFGERAGVGT